MHFSRTVGCPVDFRAEVADPKEWLVRYCQDEQPTMLVMGSHGKQGSARELGSVSEWCIRKAQVPVLVIREPK